MQNHTRLVAMLVETQLKLHPAPWAVVEKVPGGVKYDVIATDGAVILLDAAQEFADEVVAFLKSFELKEGSKQSSTEGETIPPVG